MIHKQSLIGFIGQGWIGKNYANDFEKRGYKTVRYSLEEPYIQNKDRIAECDVVFIAVPTPTTPDGFQVGIVEEALKLIGTDKVAIIKSTIVPGTTKRLQEKYPHCRIFYSPEFLSEATAQHDVEEPFSNIIGLSVDTPETRQIAEEVLTILPIAPFTEVCSSTEAEIIKYTHNANGYFQIIFFNLIFDLASKLGADWETVYKAISADPCMNNSYARPLHKSGRGAGGGCFIKDIAALRELYEKVFPEDVGGIALFRALEQKNIGLLTKSGKDMNLLHGVYGDRISML